MADTPFASVAISLPSSNMKVILDFKIQSQPTETTCGSTCLHGVYGYFKDHVSLEQIIRDVRRRGDKAKIYTYNVDMFDPTWFKEPPTKLTSFLRSQKKGTPILTGLSSTYLYKAAREIGETNETDPIRGAPTGHFVVIAGYGRKQKLLLVADPFHLNPLGEGNYYWVKTR